MPPWHTDYSAAYRQAMAEEKLLLLFFGDGAMEAMGDSLRQKSIDRDDVRRVLDQYVVAQLPSHANAVVDGESIRLLDHASFSELNDGPGVAIIDLANSGADYYGHVVTAIPFTPGKYYRYRPEHLPVLLTLPHGTLTQRTMIFAVRIHPEAPASTWGQQHPVLTAEADSHSRHQAEIAVQGHHNWETRYQRITSRLPGGVSAVEVVAESWPDQGLVDSCVDCVDSWRQSPGHWSAVRERHPLFGFDIRRGRNGIWYATGIFGRRR
jgi:hypothetical protein